MMTIDDDVKVSKRTASAAAGAVAVAPAPKVNSGWFVDKIADRRLSQRRLAKQIGMHPSAMSLLFSGDRAMSAREACEIAAALGEPVTEVLKHAGMPINAQTSGNDVSVVGWINAKGEVVRERPPGARVVNTPMPGVDGVVALRVMADGPYEGWLVFYKADTLGISGEGRLCVVETADGNDMIATLGRNIGGDVHRIDRWIGAKVSEDSATVELRSASPVLYLQQ